MSCFFSVSLINQKAQASKFLRLEKEINDFASAVRGREAQRNRNIIIFMVILLLRLPLPVSRYMYVHIFIAPAGPRCEPKNPIRFNILRQIAVDC